MAALLPATVIWAAPLMAAPTAPPTGTNSVLSVFILPTSPAAGRDPFFPQSNRTYETAGTITNRNVEVTALVLKGFSGSPDHRLVIINNHTFAAGDAGDVTTSQGRIHVRCVEIKSRSVVIEVDGQYHELTPSDNP